MKITGDIEINLLTAPKVLTFSFEYKDYFNNWGDGHLDDSDSMFKTRSLICRMLPEKFNLADYFDEKASLDDSISSSPISKSNIKVDCELVSIVGYYGHHYIAYVLSKSWYKCEDSLIRKIGSFTELLDHLEASKIIPYMVFYKCKELNAMSTDSSQEEDKDAQSSPNKRYGYTKENTNQFRSDSHKL